MRKITLIFVLLSLLIFKNTGSAVGWLKVGPNYGGPYGFVFHPTKNVIFTTGGSLLRSTDEGRTWAETGNGISNFRIDPFNPDSMVSINYSVLTTSDQGISWKEVSRYPFGYANSVRDYEFHSTSENILYAVSSNGNFHKSINGGETWSHILLPQQDNIIGVEVDSMNGDRIFLMGSKFLFESNDGGLNFNASAHYLSDKYFRPALLTLDKRNRDVLYTHTFYAIFRSSNAGKNWERIECDCRSQKIIIDPQDSTRLYLVTDDYKALTSSDWGRTWKNLKGLPPGIITLEPHPRTPGYLLVSAGRGIYRSTDFGNTWTFQKGVFAFIPEKIVALPQKTGKLFGLFAGSIYASNNFGKSWQRVLQNGSLVNLQIHPLKTNILVAGGDKGIITSTDGGTTWKSTNSPPARQFLLDRRDENIMYLITEGSENIEGGKIAVTNDFGKSWEYVNRNIPTEEIRAIAIDPQNSAVLFVSTQERVIYSSNNRGKTWVKVGEFEFLIESLVILPKNPSIMFINGGWYRSTDRGRTWNKSLWGSATEIVIDETTSSLYATGTGLQISTDNGKTWSLFDQRGLSKGSTDRYPSYVYDVVVNPWKSGGLILSGAFGIHSYSRDASGPVITQISPQPAKAGQTIKIIGNDFGEIVGEVRFAGGATGNIIAWSNKRISVQIPTEALPGSITLRARDGRKADHGFLLLPQPSNVLPSNGPATGGTRVYLNGTNIRGYIYFGTNLARNCLTIEHSSEQTLVSCLTPPGTGTVPISLVSDSGASSFGSFTYR